MYRVLIFLCAFLCGIQCTFGSGFIPNIRAVRFLVTVNDTWIDPPGCIDTVATNMIRPNLLKNESEPITVGSCDHGPLNYTVTNHPNGHNKYTVSLTFFSSSIEDADPPTCDISWNGTYLLPRKQCDDVNLLPSCYTEDSREGHSVTYYWFQILDWEFDDNLVSISY